MSTMVATPSPPTFDDYTELRTRRNCRVLTFAELVSIVANEVAITPERIAEVLTREGKSAEDFAAAVADLQQRRREAGRGAD
jgi:hypothetical protein